MSETKTNTEVTQVSADELDNLLGMPGASVANMSPGSDDPAPAPDKPEKPTFFQKDQVDMSVLDDPGATDDPPADPPADTDDPAEPGTTDDPDNPAEPGSFDEIVDEIEPGADDGEPSKGGRPKLDKAGMAQLTKALIDDKVILPFDEDKPLEDYTMDDFKELITLNFQEKEKQIKEQTPKEFFEALPQELQYAAEYVANGGQDLKGLFKALSASEETKSLDPTTERGQETIVREYLRATRFGTDEEIQEEIDSWKDLEKLEAKANQFKPKLDAMQEQVVQQRVREQEMKKKQQQEASLQYANSIYETLAKGELNGIKLDNKTQNMLYQGLIQPNYPSVSGQQTNLFGHLIEKHQFVEPNHGLIAEALYLLADPEGYRAKIREGASNAATEEAVRQLKMEQQNNKASSGNDPEPPKGQGQRRTIKRPDKNFFKF